MTELDDLGPGEALPKKVVRINESSTPSRQRNSKHGTTEIDPNDSTTMESTTEKPAGTDKVLKISVVEKA